MKSRKEIDDLLISARRLLKELKHNANEVEFQIKFANSIKNLKAQEKSQDEYMEKYKDLEILTYDAETFMPIYKGVPKWKSEN